jgi:predicted pyridoxine 5'-phosphate oxidase superfamily flavin-nucleotide-binding protein
MLFIGQRDSFYLASISEAGWPDVQLRDGAPGFIRAINPKTLIFHVFAGKQPPPTAGDVAVDNRVAMIFMDYAKSRRLKVTGRLTVAPLEDAPYLAAELFQSIGEAEVERVGSIRVEAFDWSRPRHISRRYTAAELAPLTRRVSALEAENAILQAKIARLTGQGT